MDAVGGAVLFFGFEAEHRMSVVADRAGDVFKGFGAFQTHLSDFTRRHPLQQKFSSYKSERTYFVCYVEKE